MVTFAEFTPLESPVPRVKHTTLADTTPAVVVQALSIGYPLLKVTDHVLGVLTWSTADKFESLLVLSIYLITVRHFEKIMIYWFPLVLSLSLAALLSWSNTAQAPAPTLEETIYVLERAGRRYRKFISPLKSVNVTGKEIVRFVLSSMLLSPFYIVLSVYAVSFKTIMLVVGGTVLSWHSLWFRVARSIAWRCTFVRWVWYLLTGVDRTGRSSGEESKPPAASVSLAEKIQTQTDKPKRDVTFTFVVLENQRHWIGVGWTSSMLPEERSAWTDTGLNEVSSIDTFELPVAEGEGMTWTWMDQNWQLDLTNGGTIPISDSLPKRTAVPGPDDGFVYYNNWWLSPSTYCSFSKYTRSRRWVRTASLSSVAEAASEKLRNTDLSDSSSTLRRRDIKD